MTDLQKLNDLREMLTNMERTLRVARTVIAELSGEKPLVSSDQYLADRFGGLDRAHSNSEGRIIEGVFDGVSMQDGEGKVYPVPANYSSKSKIVVGDKMKLTITPDGKFIYKQIGPVERKNVVGPLVFEDGQHKVLANGKEYKILMASITFHKAEVGDDVSILLPEEGDAEWGALDVVIPHTEDAETYKF
ncbi:MAG: hypothetical protein WCJ84_04065 [Candidatus Peregrinibacteria bacterium]